MPPSRKGLQDIRSYAGRATSPGSNHRDYIRLSTLEMERMRRHQEYVTAQARADAAKERVDRLEAEIAEIVERVADRAPSAPNAEKPRAVAADPSLIAVKHAYGVKQPPLPINPQNDETEKAR